MVAVWNGCLFCDDTKEASAKDKQKVAVKRKGKELNLQLNPFG